MSLYECATQSPFPCFGTYTKNLRFAIICTNSLKPTSRAYIDLYLRSILLWTELRQASWSIHSLHMTLPDVEWSVRYERRRGVARGQGLHLPFTSCPTKCRELGVSHRHSVNMNNWINKCASYFYKLFLFFDSHHSLTNENIKTSVMQIESRAYSLLSNLT